MRVILKPVEYRVKNGFAAHSPELGVTAHGHSTEIARQNLERTAVLYLRSFQRQGVLESELDALSLNVDEADEVELRVLVTA